MTHEVGTIERVFRVVAGAEQRFDQRLLGRLREIHGPWLRCVRVKLKAARPADAGMWARWSAIHYVNTVFSVRFERERALVESLVYQKLEGNQGSRLWAAGELVAVLRWQLAHLAGACHDAAEFASVTLKLDGALEHWCREVEATLGQLTWSEVPEKSRQLLRTIDDQENPHGT